MPEKVRIFFPNLDGLRFFSFLIVFFSHAFHTDKADIKEEGWYEYFKGKIFLDGDLGVSFFFVLSGFLITYLLLKEKEYTGKINVINFYIRRILRIWPLYYFCVFFGFVIFPLLKKMMGQVPNETSDPVLCSIFLNNFDRIINGPPDSHVLSVLWSVAIEEQFYLLWPVLFFLIPTRFYKYIFFVIIALSVFYRATNLAGNVDTHTLGVISDMAIGGLGAYLSINSQRFVKAIEQCSPFLHLIPYLAVIIFILFKYELFSGAFMLVIKRIVTCSFFIWIILEQNFSNRSFFKVSKLKTISNLGKYTYGLYCLHTIAGLSTIVILSQLGWDKYSWQLWFIQLPMFMGLSILFSYISYHYFEKRFLKLKERFAYITK
jgi:peptidoglycan/LPS O-acetylase OafA/YrhL